MIIMIMKIIIIIIIITMVFIMMMIKNDLDGVINGDDNDYDDGDF